MSSTGEVSVPSPPAPNKAGKGPGLNLLLMFLPSILSILFFRWDLLSTAFTSNHIQLSSTILTHDSNPPGSQDQLHDIYELQCPQIDYKIRIFSYDPVIIYIEGFLPPWERTYLLNLAEKHYTRSKVYKNNRTNKDISEHRTSQSAHLPEDPVRECIMQRAGDFQGGISTNHIESLQLVKYDVGKEYKTHYDWSTSDDYGRISTFFVYALCEGSGKITVDEFTSVDKTSESSNSGKCEGGETWFPEYDTPFGPKWCDVVDCEDKEEHGGVLFKAIPGNAIFWSNIYANGTYHEGTGHAGMPVKSGKKIGVNIWTRNGPAYDYDDEKMIKEDEEVRRKTEELKKIREKLRVLREAEAKKDESSTAIEPTVTTTL